MVREMGRLHTYLMLVGLVGCAPAGSSVDAPGGAPPAPPATDPGTVAMNGPEPTEGCVVTRTPVVFVHGNADSADAWKRRAATGAESPYEVLLDGGYRECELFAVTWLDAGERATPLANVHDRSNAVVVGDFIAGVLAKTGRSQVDVIAHSMGVTVAMHALDFAATWPSVRRFIAVAGALRGLESCMWTRAYNPAAPTCMAQSATDTERFGFYPLSNQRMQEHGFRAAPTRTGTIFFAIAAGAHDEVLCPAGATAGCDTWQFDPNPTVRAQLDVGDGTPGIATLDDSTGIGHFRALSVTGALQLRMLQSDCTGADCCVGYSGPCAAP
jgi:pimeloyl-ACP methyl ester carboxylesterase